MKTPVLFIIFNRPEATQRVFAEIRKARPEKLFIAADGPRPDRHEDIEKCRRSREAVATIDWPCEVKTLFQEKNLGCKIGATTGISWFFDHVEEGMILEDDCLPDQSFFPFCEKMLAHYRTEEKIAMICGYNISGASQLPYSYTFSRYGHLWGWASWRRIWKQYDVTMKVWASADNRKKIREAMGDGQQWNYRQWLYQETFLGRKDTWDYQWESYRLLHGQLSVIPSKNMIENLGFGADATHTKQLSSHLVIPRRAMEFPLVHNPHIQPDDSYDVLLRPQIPAQSMAARLIKNRMKRFAKHITPPFLYEIIRRSVKGSKKFKPIWNTLEYEPMKGLRMFFDPKGPWQKKMIDGSYDLFLFDRLKEMGATSKIFFDIGAHIGFHSLYFAALAGKDGTVYSFEPNKINTERFKLILGKNPEIAKRIRTFNVAVSDSSGTEEFNIHKDIESGRSSGNFLEHTDPFWSKDVYALKGFEKAQVRMVPIDAFEKELGIHDSPDIIKIDVEGAEYLVLLGAQNTLLTKRPILFIEVHSIVNMFNVVTLLSALKYDMKILKKEANGVCFIEAWPKK